MDAIVERALADGCALRDAGFHALVVENYGDRPFVRTGLSSASVAAMGVAANEVRRETGLPIGINALRNDAEAALGIAAAAGATFIRVNVHTGVYVTDQGIIEGRAAETLQYRKQLECRVAILADVQVKHAVPLGETDIARLAKDTAYRGMADGLIVTGPATGESAELEDIRRVREAVPDRRLFAGSGVTVPNVAEILRMTGGIIVGTGVKQGGKTENAVDPVAARALVIAARGDRQAP